MIDVYPQISTELESFIQAYMKSSERADCLQKKQVRVRTEFEDSTSSFPYITIGEKGNEYADNELDNQEKHSSLVYDINIYDNSKMKMKICSTLALVVNEYMSEKMGFKRTFHEPLPNVRDNTIYRITQRYEGYIDNETGVITKNIL